jgi:hypothetical protein
MARLAAATGSTVVVVFPSKPALSGTLGAVSPSQLVVRVAGRDEIVPLSSVLSVEKVTHHTRTLALFGAPVGFAVIGVPCLTGDCGATQRSGRMLRSVIGMAAGAALGAAVGAVFDHWIESRNPLYDRTAVPRTTEILPIIAPGRVGAGVAMTWR